MATPNDELEDLLRVALTPGIGPLTFRELINRFGTPGAILQSSPQALRETPRVGARVVKALQDARDSESVHGVLETCREYSIDIVTQAAENYPRLLHEIPDPPPVLFVRGELLPADRRCVAIVGSRNASGYGRRMAERFSRDLTQAGLVVVSGLARGIDAAGHRAALQAGGRTLAVLGGGVLNIYPPEHVRLAQLIEASGALLSESPPFQSPRSGSFPRRNRLISGMSMGVVVIEASRRSGALISARHAVEQGREVFAVPGRIDTPTAAGCNQLIKDGAKLVETVADILEELGPLGELSTAACSRLDSQAPEELTPTVDLSLLSETERAVFDHATDDGVLIDQVISASQRSAPQVLAAISSLEMKKLLRRLGGAMIARA